MELTACSSPVYRKRAVQACTHQGRSSLPCYANNFIDMYVLKMHIDAYENDTQHR